MVRDRNWGAERLVDGGRRCTVLPALNDVFLCGGFRQSNEEGESLKSKEMPQAVVRQKQQQSFVERMYRGRKSSLSCGPPDVLEEVRQLITLQGPGAAPLLPKSARRSARGSDASIDSGSPPDLPADVRTVRQALSARAPELLPLEPNSAREGRQSVSAPSAPQQFPAAIARVLNFPLGGDRSVQSTKVKRRSENPQDLFNSVLPQDEWAVVRRRSTNSQNKKWNPLAKLTPVRIAAEPTSARCSVGNSNPNDVSGIVSVNRKSEESADPAAASTRASSRDSRKSLNQQPKRSDTPASDIFPPRQRQSKKHDKLDVLERVPPDGNISLERRYACEGLRSLVFGKVRNEKAMDPKSKQNVFQESIGTKQSVLRVFKFWLMLDSNRSGRVDLRELSEFVHQPGAPQAQRTAGDKVIGLLVNRASKSFGLEDIMRIAWPTSSMDQLKQMDRWVVEYLATESLLVTDPPVLGEDERDALTRNFRHISSMTALQQDESLLELPEASIRTVKFDALIKGAILDRDEAKRCCEVWGCGWADDIYLEEFLMMMCPAGFCAFEGATAAVSNNGDMIILKDGSWRLKETPSKSRGTSRAPSQLSNRTASRLSDTTMLD